jgi:CDGSH-type Zn-finger protein
MTSPQTNPPSKPKIKVTKNGPYLAIGNLPLSEQEITLDAQNVPIGWTQHTQHVPKQTCALCRCGQTSKKPFCDGTHTKINFDGTETAEKESYLANPTIIEGPALTLVDVEALCASARFCHRAGGIWNLVPQSGDSTAKQTACEEAANCPSGRLVLQDKQTGKPIEPYFEPSIILIEDPSVGVSGPIWVRGNISIESADGKTYQTRNRVTLCRCGKSKNKPFCDSSHYPEEHEPHGGN